MRYVFGDYALDAQRYELRRGGTPIKVRPKVFDVLAYLIAHRERVVAKQELLEHLWPHQFIGDATLNSCIMEARQAVGDTGQAQRIIQTLYGRGYRFVAPVESPSREPPAETPLGMATGPHDPVAHTEKHPDAAASTVSLSAAQGDAARSGPVTMGRAPAQPGRTPTPSLEGERKPVTVLCCALTNATGLAETLGPDAMHSLMRGFLDLAQHAIRRYEGTITQCLGDGFVALFGAPIAHEDHARRGVLAAVDLQRRLREHGPRLGHTASEALAVGIGLHTGSVVVGALGEDGRGLFTAVGPTTHLATHLQQRAEPGTILLSEAMSRLLAEYVNVEPFCRSCTTDHIASAPAYKLIGLAPRRSPVARREVRALSRFVGRQREFAALHTLLAQAESGQGQVVGMVGEAGLGKSRLLDEFRQSLQGRPVTYLEGRCLSYGQNTPYLPMLDLLRHLCGITDADSPEAVTTKVHLALQEVGMDPDAGGPFLLHLLGAQAGTEWLAPLTPAVIKTRTFATLQQLILSGRRQGPLILAVEDLHWVDAASEEWLVSMVDRLANAPLLLLTTYRPGYRLLWVDKSYATQMALPRLTRRESQSVVQSALHTAPIADALLQAILEKGAGNPFFLEELARTAVESREHGPTLAVPDTVQAVLAARIDRLPPEAKHLLQTAAVIGMDVPFALLQPIVELSEEKLRDGMVTLQAAEFLYEMRLFPEYAYTFKHVLTQQVAYESLLQERRCALHARIVEALEALAGDRVAEQVERLAHHALRGEVWGKALEYSRQAGEKALPRSAYREAVGFFEKALSALPHLPETHDTREQAIDLRLALRSALQPTGDGGRILAALREAEALAKALDDPRRLGQVSGLLSLYFYLRGAYDQAIAAAQRVLALATAGGDAVLSALANQYFGYAHHGQGDYRRAIDCLRQAVPLLEGSRRRERFGQTILPAVLSRAYLAWCHAELGMFTEGRALGDEGLRIAEAVDHPPSLMIASWGIGLLALRQGDLTRALPLLERAICVCQEADLPLYFPWMAGALGAAYTLGGRFADAVPQLTRAIEQAIAREWVSSQALCRLSLGEAQVLAGRLEEAHALAKGTLAHAHSHQERGHQAYALRLLGDIAVRREPPASEQAEAHYRHALALADELGMCPLQAHCHRGLGTLYAAMGRRAEARAELSTAIELYHAMEMTFWLPEAEAALARV